MRKHSLLGLCSSLSHCMQFFVPLHAVLCPIACSYIRCNVECKLCSCLCINSTLVMVIVPHLMKALQPKHCALLYCLITSFRQYNTSNLLLFCKPVCLCLTVCLSVSLSVPLSVHLSFCLSIRLSVCLSV